MRAISTPILLFFFLGCGAGPQPAAAPALPASQPVATADPAASPAPTSQPAPTTQAAVLPNDGTRQMGDVTRCPVSQEVFTVSAESFEATHEGKSYYVCCRGCAQKFAQNPARFLAR